MLCLHKADMFQTKKLVSKIDLLNISQNSKNLETFGKINLEPEKSEREMIKVVKRKE